MTTDKDFPLYMKYTGQLQPQRAYIEVDADGNVSADYDANSGGLPADVWNGTTHWYFIRPEVHKDQLPELIQLVKDNHERIMQDEDSAWEENRFIDHLDGLVVDYGTDYEMCEECSNLTENCDCEGSSE